MDRELYKTKNLYVAAYLRVKNVEFISIETLDYKTKLFIFTPFGVAKMFEGEYYQGGVVSAVDLFSEYNKLKDMLFSDQSRN